jgi:hypothetical protein
VQYKGDKTVPVGYYKNIFFTTASKKGLKSTKDVDTGSEWFNYALKVMVETQTRDM